MREMCDTLSRSWGRPCRTCGQHHARHEPHVYDYTGDVDDDLNCHICLQPLVSPLDTPCGHTFCGGCLVPFLSQQQTCPTCRQPLTTHSCRSSPLVLLKLLDKLTVKCPNSASTETGVSVSEDVCQLSSSAPPLSRGELEDHLRHRCPGNFIACCYSVHGCQMRGPPRTVHRHQTECEFRAVACGSPRSSIVAGCLSHVDIPRTSTQLGMTIVGGCDTPLRCVVVQEVFADGLIAQDGRLQAGDQIVEVNGVDVSASAHHAVCHALRRQAPVLRLGIYREKVDVQCSSVTEHSVMTVTLTKLPGQALGIKLVSRPTSSSQSSTPPPSSSSSFPASSSPRSEDGVFVGEVIEGSTAAIDTRLSVEDRILFINGQDVRHNCLQLACELIQANTTVSLVVARGGSGSKDVVDSCLGNSSNVVFSDGAKLSINHCRTKSAPDRLSLVATACADGRSSVPLLCPKVVGGVDTVDRDISIQSRGESMDHLSAPDPPVRPPKLSLPTALGNGGSDEMMRRRNKEPRRSILRIESELMQQKTVTIAKKARESLGVRVGGGINCNEGDTPIYIANINHHGPVGKSGQVKKGDIVLSVNGRTLVGLTHADAVVALKSTADLPGVTLSVLDGPETTDGPAKFIPSWLYWQSLPLCLCSPRSVEVHRTGGGSLGFSIVGGCDGGTQEPVHVLFVVRGSPAAVQGRLRCGDRLLAVDGASLSGLRHADAVALLKQALDRVKLQVVSFMGTEV